MFRCPLLVTGGTAVYVRTLRKQHEQQQPGVIYTTVSIQVKAAGDALQDGNDAAMFDGVGWDKQDIKN